MNEHVGRLRLFHVDAYRLDDPEEALAAGLLDERQAAGVTVIEWADRLAGWLPDERLEIAIDARPGTTEQRTLRWTALGRAWRAGLATVLAGRRTVIIAIESASTDPSVALAEPGRHLIGLDGWSGAIGQARELLPRLLALLDEAERQRGRDDRGRGRHRIRASSPACAWG